MNYEIMYELEAGAGQFRIFLSKRKPGNVFRDLLAWKPFISTYWVRKIETGNPRLR